MCRALVVYGPMMLTFPVSVRKKQGTVVRRRGVSNHAMQARGTAGAYLISPKLCWLQRWVYRGQRYTKLWAFPLYH
jgi:hypothetical protein